MNALEVQDQEIERLKRGLLWKVGLRDWGWATDTAIREMAEIKHERPLLEFRENQQIQPLRRIKTKAELNFHRYLINVLFNRGEPGEVTYPPLEEEEDPRRLPRRNLLWRRMIIQTLNQIDPRMPETRTKVRDWQRVTYRKLVIKACRDDPVFFAGGFCWGYDPRLNEAQRTRPFVPWPKQQQMLYMIRDAIESPGPYLHPVIEKGRDVGATFIVLIEILRRWLFFDESFLIVTLKETLLDSRKPDSAFGKLRFLFNRLPDWMHPEQWTGLSLKGYDKEGSLTKPVWVPDFAYKYQGTWRAMGPAIDGYAATADVAVGRRYMAMFVDEHGAIGEEKPGRDAEIYLRSADSLKCRISSGTPRGKGTMHSQLARRARANEEVGRDEDKLIYMHINWEDDPRKNRPLFRLTVRPKQYMDMQDYYAILLRLYYAERDKGEFKAIELVAGKPLPEKAWTSERQKRYDADYSKCQPLDPVIDRKERLQHWSPWCLAKCKDLAVTKEGQRTIITDVFGIQADDATYFFSQENLERQPTGHHEIAGDMLMIGQDWRMAQFSKHAVGNVYVWEEPKAGRFYGMTSDSGLGQGMDYSVVSIWDITDWPIRQVCKFRDNRTGPERLSEYCCAMAHWYSTKLESGERMLAYWCPEANAEGRATISRALLELKFPRRFVYVRGDHPKDPLDIQPYGWRSAFHEGRKLLFQTFREEFEDRQTIQIRSEILKEELGNILVESKDGRPYQPDHEQGSGHDDEAITAVLVPQMVKGANQSYFGRLIFDVLGAEMAAKEKRHEMAGARMRMRQLGDHQGSKEEAIPIFKVRKRETVGNML